MYYGEKVYLRAFKEEDIEKDSKFMNDKELQRLLMSTIAFPMTLWEEEDFIKSQKNDNSGHYNFAIDDIVTGKYIGTCGILKINWLARVATIGIMIGDKEYWGKGYGTDAMKVLIKFIFEEMNINKIRLDAFSFNERAINCYKKCGFEVEGVLKDEVFKEGKYSDKIVMSLFNKNQV